MVYQRAYRHHLAASWRVLTFGQNLNYNVPGGKLNRGISVVDSFQVLKGATLTEDEYQKAAILGWCVELVSLALAPPGSVPPFLTTA